MSLAVTSSPANQDRPLLMHPSSQPSDNQRRIRTLLDLLTVEKMDGGDRITLSQGEENNNTSSSSKWKILKERLGLKLIGCCGAGTWQFENSSPPEEDTNNNENVVGLEEANTHQQGEDYDNNNSNYDVAVEVGPTTGMNLGAALAAERQFRAGESRESYSEDERTIRRVSLMRLLEERTDGCDMERERESKGEEYEENGRSDRVCCVCMERKKGAAFIPCGHTYCRVCSRELWLNRGSCPLCNRPILEILDIF